MLEGGSASLVENLLTGKPVIVSNSGHYKDLPDDVVIKIDVDKEASELKTALNLLINNVSVREEIGKKGKEYAENNFNSENYVNKLLGFFEDVKYNSPLIKLVDKIGMELSVMKVKQDNIVLDIVSDEIALMCPGEIQE